MRWERGTVIPNGPADSLLRLLAEYSHAAEYLAQLHQVSLPPSAETPRLATFAEAIYVLHAFEKKSQKTTRRELAVATQRLSASVRDREGR